MTPEVAAAWDKVQTLIAQGAYYQAEAVLDNLEPKHKAVSLVAREKSLLCRLSGRRTAARTALLEDTLTHTSTGCRLLVAMDLAMLHVYLQGSLKQGLDEAHKQAEAALSQHCQAPEAVSSSDLAEALCMRAVINLMAVTQEQRPAALKEEALAELKRSIPVLRASGKVFRSFLFQIVAAEHAEDKCHALLVTAAEAQRSHQLGSRAECLIRRAGILMEREPHGAETLATLERLHTVMPGGP